MDHSDYGDERNTENDQGEDAEGDDLDDEDQPVSGVDEDSACRRQDKEMELEDAREAEGDDDDDDDEGDYDDDNDGNGNDYDPQRDIDVDFQDAGDQTPFPNHADPLPNAPPPKKVIPATPKHPQQQPPPQQQNPNKNQPNRPGGGGGVGGKNKKVIHTFVLDIPWISTKSYDHHTGVFDVQQKKHENKQLADQFNNPQMIYTQTSRRKQELLLTSFFVCFQPTPLGLTRVLKYIVKDGCFRHNIVVEGAMIYRIKMDIIQNKNKIAKKLGLKKVFTLKDVSEAEFIEAMENTGILLAVGFGNSTMGVGNPRAVMSTNGDNKNNDNKDAKGGGVLPQASSSSSSIKKPKYMAYAILPKGYGDLSQFDSNWGWLAHHNQRMGKSNPFGVSTSRVEEISQLQTDQHHKPDLFQIRLAANTQKQLRHIFEIAFGVANLHAMGFVHCDLKNGNANSFGKCMVTDHETVRLACFDPSETRGTHHIITEGNVPIETAGEASYYNMGMDVWSYGLMFLRVLGIRNFYMTEPVAGNPNYETLSFSKLIKFTGDIFTYDLWKEYKLPEKASYYIRTTEPNSRGDSPKESCAFQYLLNNYPSWKAWVHTTFLKEDQYLLMDLINGIFRLDPRQRFTMQQIINHPFWAFVTTLCGVFCGPIRQDITIEFLDKMRAFSSSPTYSSSSSSSFLPSSQTIVLGSSGTSLSRVPPPQQQKDDDKKVEISTSSSMSTSSSSSSSSQNGFTFCSFIHEENEEHALRELQRMSLEKDEIVRVWTLYKKTNQWPENHRVPLANRQRLSPRSLYKPLHESIALTRLEDLTPQEQAIDPFASCQKALEPYLQPELILAARAILKRHNLYTTSPDSVFLQQDGLAALYLVITFCAIIVDWNEIVRVFMYHQGATGSSQQQTKEVNAVPIPPLVEEKTQQQQTLGTKGDEKSKSTPPSKEDQLRLFTKALIKYALDEFIVRIHFDVFQLKVSFHAYDNWKFLEQIMKTKYRDELENQRVELASSTLSSSSSTTSSLPNSALAV